MPRRLTACLLIFCLTFLQAAQAYTQAWLPHRPAHPHGEVPIPLTPEQKAAQHKAALAQQLDTLASQPGQEWIGQLAKQDNVKYNQVKLAAESWNYSQSGLTPEAAAVIVIVVTYFSAGTAGEWAAGLAGEGTATAAALSAGMVTLASQSAVSLINNNGVRSRFIADRRP